MSQKTQRRQKKQARIRWKYTPTVDCVCAKCGGPAVLHVSLNGPGLCLCPECSYKPQKGSEEAVAEYNRDDIRANHPKKDWPRIIRTVYDGCEDIVEHRALFPSLTDGERFKAFRRGFEGAIKD